MSVTITLIVFIISIITFLLSLFSLFICWRLYKYMTYVIEDKQEGESERVDNIIQTLKIIVKEGLVKDDGRIKKPYILKSSL